MKSEVRSQKSEPMKSEVRSQKSEPMKSEVNLPPTCPQMQKKVVAVVGEVCHVQKKTWPKPYIMLYIKQGPQGAMVRDCKGVCAAAASGRGGGCMVH